MRFLFYSSFLPLVSLTLFAQDPASPCKRIVLEGPAGITQPGDPVEFKVERPSENGNGSLTYEWRVKAFLFSGQGTSRIAVQTDRLVGRTVIPVSVIVTDHEYGCRILLSETASVVPSRPGPDHFWSELNVRDNSYLKGHLDVFFAELDNNPGQEGIIELTFEKNQSRDRRRSRLSLIAKHIAYRRFDFSKISYHITSGEHERVRVIRMPPGADYDFLKIDRKSLVKAERYKSKTDNIF